LKADARETELQAQWASDLRLREEEWERQSQSRVQTAETRLALEAQQKEELLQSKLRQRDQQWQVRLDAAKAETLAQNEVVLRRRATDAEGALRELEAELRKEMEQKEEAAQARAAQREQELKDQFIAQAQARQAAVQAEWDTELEKRTRAAVEPFKVIVSRTEKERDAAKDTALFHANKVQHLERKLTEASTFLNGWRNGDKLVPVS
jgi:hypothetical protein